MDATAVPSDRGGVGRYVDGLVAALADQPVELSVVCQRSDADRYRRLDPVAHVVPAPAAVAHRPARLAWEQTGLPLLATQLDADVLHSPHYTMPLRLDKPVVVTVHDATVFTSPEVHSARRATFTRSAVRTALRRSTRCVVPSAATRDDLVRSLGADPDRIDVVPHGVDPAVFHRPSEAELQRVAARLSLGGRPYIAFLGVLEPRKNVAALVEGWVAACADRPDPPALVLAGGTGWDARVHEVLSQVPEQLRAISPGFLRDSDLAGFLGGAALVAAPSLAEGFGLPVLEAMACGAPVLADSGAASRELGGDAVAYTGTDPASIAESLTALLDDEERRRSLAEAGLARAAGFTWASSAQAHVESYRRALGG